jgi:hyperosmotically inducible protein
MTHVKTKIAMALALGIATSFGAVQTTLAQNAPGDTSATEKSEQPVTDTWITTKVKSELAVTKGVNSMDIKVDTANGIVTLIGTQDTKLAIDKAVAVARGVKGVKDVDYSALKAKG